MVTLADWAEQEKAPDLKRKGVDLICDNGAQRSVDGFRSHKNQKGFGQWADYKVENIFLLMQQLGM